MGVHLSTLILHDTAIINKREVYVHLRLSTEVDQVLSASWTAEGVTHAQPELDGHALSQPCLQPNPRSQITLDE